MKETERRLKAIMFADIKSFSVMMGSNEELTVRMVREFRKIFRDVAREFHAEERGTAGDSLFMLFDSASEAVLCAQKIQGIMNLRNRKKALTSPKEQIWIRIGIHLGEVIYDQQSKDVFGDDVNIASRVEQISEPGGIAVTEALLEQAGRKLELKYKELNASELKNIKDCPRLFSLILDVDVDSTPRFFNKQNPRMSLGSELSERRVLRALAGYLALSWGMIEAGSFFISRFNMGDSALDLLILTLFSGIPVCLVYAWYHGRPGKQDFERHQHVKALSGFLCFFIISVFLFTLKGSDEKNHRRQSADRPGGFSSESEPFPDPRKEDLRIVPVNPVQNTGRTVKKEKLIGYLRVQTNHEAEVSVKKTGTSEWRILENTPVRHEPLEAGHWVVRLSGLPGKRKIVEWTDTVEIAAGRTVVLSKKLEFMNGKICLTWDPEDAEATLNRDASALSRAGDGGFTGGVIRSGQELELGPGTWSLQLKRKGYVDESRTFEVFAGKEIEENILMQKAQIPESTVKILVKPQEVSGGHSAGEGTVTLSGNKVINSGTVTSSPAAKTAYEEYMKAYAALTEVMKNGGQDTPEARKYYQKYKEAKDRYEKEIVK